MRGVLTSLSCQGTEPGGGYAHDYSERVRVTVGVTVAEVGAVEGSTRAGGRFSRRQVVVLFLMAFVGAGVVAAAGDVATLVVLLLLQLGPFVLLLDPGFRRRTIRIEQRVYERWRGRSVFETGLYAMVTFPFYVALFPYVALIHVPELLMRGWERLQRYRSSRPRGEPQAGGRRQDGSTRPRRSRPGLVVLLYALLYVGVFSQFWSRVAEDPSVLRDAPMLTATNLLLQLFALAPALFLRDPAYRARLAGSFAWLRGQWRATSLIVRIVLLALLVPTGGLVVLLLYVPAVVLLRYLFRRGGRMNLREDSDEPVAVAMVEAPGSESSGVTELFPPQVGTEAPASPPEAPPVMPEPPTRRAWGGSAKP
jgi:hypothetical protein